MNKTVEDVINNTIWNVDTKIEELKLAMFELQYMVLDYRERINQILKIDIHNINHEINENDFEFDPDVLINTANAISNEIKKLEATLDKLLPAIEKKVKRNFKHISSEIIAKKYSENISKMREQVSTLSANLLELQKDVYDVSTTLSIHISTIKMLKEIIRQPENTQNNTTQATQKEDENQSIKEKKLALLSSQEFDPNTEALIRRLIENSDLEIGKLVYSYDCKRLAGIKHKNNILYFNNETDLRIIKRLLDLDADRFTEDANLLVFNNDVYTGYNNRYKEYTRVGPKSFLSLSDEFGIPDKNNHTVIMRYTNFYDFDIYTASWVPEEECTIDEVAQIEEKKQKIQLLKRAKALNPQKYFRLGKVYSEAKGLFVIVSRAILIDANIDPEDVYWRDITKDTELPEMKTAKRIIRAAKIRSIPASVLNNIKGIFEKKEPLLLVEKKCERE